jgi:hypothetical protein
MLFEFDIAYKNTNISLAAFALRYDIVKIIQ